MNDPPQQQPEGSYSPIHHVGLLQLYQRVKNPDQRSGVLRYSFTLDAADLQHPQLLQR
jgi:hypothetical protein